MLSRPVEAAIARPAVFFSCGKSLTMCTVSGNPAARSVFFSQRLPLVGENRDTKENNPFLVVVHARVPLRKAALFVTSAPPSPFPVVTAALV